MVNYPKLWWRFTKVSEAFLQRRITDLAHVMFASFCDLVCTLNLVASILCSEMHNGGCFCYVNEDGTIREYSKVLMAWIPMTNGDSMTQGPVSLWHREGLSNSFSHMAEKIVRGRVDDASTEAFTSLPVRRHEKGRKAFETLRDFILQFLHPTLTDYRVSQKRCGICICIIMCSC